MIYALNVLFSPLNSIHIAIVFIGGGGVCVSVCGVCVRYICIFPPYHFNLFKHLKWFPHSLTFKSSFRRSTPFYISNFMQ